MPARFNTGAFRIFAALVIISTMLTIVASVSTTRHGEPPPISTVTIHDTAGAIVDPGELWYDKYGQHTD